MARSLLQWSTVALLLLAAATPALSAEPAGADATWGHGQIRGAVVGTDNNALIGISIVLLPRGNPHVAYATSTDDHGRFSFDHLLSDRYQVRAEGQGFVALLKEPVQVQPPFRAIIALEMEAGQQTAPQDDGEELTGTVRRIEGRFVDGEGRPVLEGAVVFRRLDHPEDIFYGRTDKDGFFEVHNLPAGIYDITARSPGLLPLHLVHHPLPATENFSIRLVAPPYPLSFRGWLDDLLPMEVPLPPPFPHTVDDTTP